MRALPFLLLLLLAPVGAQDRPRADLRDVIEVWRADRDLLERRHDTPLSAQGRTALGALHEACLAGLQALPDQDLARAAVVDRLLLERHCRHELAVLARRAEAERQTLAVLTFAPPLVALHEAFRDRQDPEPEATAALLARAAAGARECRQQAGQGRFDDLTPGQGRLLLQDLGALRSALAGWFRFHDGYHPLFSWWCKAPWQDLDLAMRELQQALQGRLVDRAGDQSLVGTPFGEAALREELAFEAIPYSPAELVAIAEREFAWCDREMAAAAAAMGCGDDWRLALERVKQRHRAPGQQPALIRELADEAVTFLRQRDLITVPELAGHGWRMSMLSAEAQRVNPFFLGGEVIQVSFPTDAMDHDQKLQSLRSNNEHFCRATVHHELIPGHWLQQYSQARHRPYRRVFGTPFWTEGWALYWEMRLYDLGLGRTPEDRVGMLYWRKHRCARIVFSLNYHLGLWDAERCIAWLIDRVGHEPRAAEGEVRRSLTGGYGPLYQAAYMLGGLQFRALHGEQVSTGQLTEKAFHDAVLAQNCMPVAILRLALRPELAAGDAAGWRFADR